MAGRRTNLGLRILLPLAAATGGLAFALGTGWGRWATVAHGVAGAGVVVLSPWKSVVVRRGVRRRRDDLAVSVLFGLAVVGALVTGLLHSTGAVMSIAGVATMNVHVGAGLVALPLFVVHARTHRQRWRRADLSRRAVLRAGAVGGGAVLVWGAVEGAVRVGGLAGADRRFTGSHEDGSLRPADMPVTQWFDDSVPRIDAEDWRLAVGGRDWTYRELATFDDRLRATLDCTGGWYATQDWEGVLLSRLLEGVDTSGARSVSVRSTTGYARRYPLADAGRLLVATRAGGAPLSAGHGFPARLVAPGRRGFWWVKWLERVEVSPRPWWLQSPFPLT